MTESEDRRGGDRRISCQIKPEKSRHWVQSLTLAQVGGWALIGVACYRFLKWPEVGPSSFDAISTIAILAFGGGGALPKPTAQFASWVVQISPWGASRDD